MGDTDALWIFGYGSLIWRPAFPFAERHDAVLRGWKRRFWQGSTDHRGVPGAPGRVVTLLPDAAEETWGRVFRVAPGHEAEVLAALDHREKCGYQRLTVTVEVGTPGAPLRKLDNVLVYIATEANPDYLGPAPVDDVGAHIARSVGPSGPNAEYALNLHDALCEMGAWCPHAEEVAAAVRRAAAAQEQAPLAAPQVTEHGA